MEYITNFITAVGVLVGSVFGLVPQTHLIPLQEQVSKLEQQVVEQAGSSQILGGYNTTGGGTYRLKTSASISDTTVNLSSFKEPISNIPYTMTYLNTDIGYGTIEPQVPDRSEFISFTGITQNSDGSAQLTGVIRGLNRSPAGSLCTASSTLSIRHPAQSVFIYSSDSPCHFAEYAVKRNDETVSGQWSFPYASASSSPVTLGQLNATALGTTIVDRLIVSGTAGETVYGGQILYFKQSDTRWYKAGTGTNEATSSILAIAQGSGTAGVSISGGVLLHGLDSFNVGLTAGTNYFLSSTAGATSTATSSRSIGRARSTTSLYFDPHHLSDIVGRNNTFTGTNTFTSTTTLSATSTISVGSFPIYNIGKNIAVLTTTGTSTFSVPAGITKLKVEVVAGGGLGGNGLGANGGGGSGGYSMEMVDVAGTSTIQVYVGTTDQWTTFGTNGFYLYATPGGFSSGASNNTAGAGGRGGCGFGGDLNLCGQDGGSGVTTGAADLAGGIGGASFFGGGSFGGRIGSAAAGAPQSYGGGGGGSIDAGGQALGSQGVIRITW